MPIDIDPATGAPIIVPANIPSITRTETPNFVAHVPETAGMRPLTSEVILVHPSKSAMIDSINENKITPDNPKHEILLKMGIIEEEFNGVSNIPANHEYWDFVNKYRSLK